MLPRSLSHRAPLLGILVAWGTGLALGHSIWSTTIPPALLAAIAVSALTLAWLARRRTPVWLISLFLAVAAAGALRIDQVRQRLPERDTLPPREAELKRGQVT